MTSNKPDEDYKEIVNDPKNNNENKREIENQVHESDKSKNYIKIIDELLRNNEIFKNKEYYTNKSIETIKKEIEKKNFKTIELERILFFTKNGILYGNDFLIIILSLSSTILALILVANNLLTKEHSSLLISFVLLMLFVLIYWSYRLKDTYKIQVIQRALIELIEENKDTK